MTNIDTEIEALEKQLAEAKKKKELELNKVTINIHKLNILTNKVYVTLSRPHWVIVDYLRTCPGRYTSGNNDNIISIDDLDRLFAIAKEDSNIDIIWEKKSFDVLEEWNKAPACLVELNKAWCIVKLGRKFAFTNIWLNHELSTWQQDYQTKTFKFATAELYKFPKAIQSRAPNIQITYSDGAEKELISQLKHRQTVAELTNAKDVELENPFPNKEYDLKSHQRVAVKFAELSNCKSIIAFDMGTGKSFIGIGLAERHPEWKRILIICPASLKYNWKREIKKTTGQDAIILSGVEPDGLSIDLLVDNKSRYFIINYDVIGRRTPDIKDSRGEITERGVMKWVELFNLVGVDCLILDEAHYIKNMDSRRSQGAMAVKFNSVLPMSGTPIVNRPMELYPIAHLVAPHIFSSPSAFQSQFVSSDGKPANTAKLHELLLPFMIRRTWADVYGELHVEKIPFTKELSPKARELYKMIMEGIYISLRKPDYQRNVTSILAQIMRYKQLCSSDNVETSAELAQDAYADTDKKVIITSQFKESQYAIQNILGLQSFVANGDVSKELLYLTMDEFQNKDSNIKFWITNLPEGLTLTEAHTVIHNDIWWTPKDHNQLNGRAFGRVNDPHGGRAYYLQNENTYDKFLVDLVTEKEAIVDEVIDGIKQSGNDQGSVISQLIAHIRSGM